MRRPPSRAPARPVAAVSLPSSQRLNIGPPGELGGGGVRLLLPWGAGSLSFSLCVRACVSVRVFVCVCLCRVVRVRA